MNNLFDNEKYIFNRLIEQTDNSAVLEITIPQESPYFDGHFPQVSVLPAVAQIELVLTFSKNYFNNNISIAEIKKAKFTDVILPSLPLVLRLDKNENKVSFKFSSPTDETVYSLGTVLINS